MDGSEALPKAADGAKPRGRTTVDRLESANLRLVNAARRLHAGDKLAIPEAHDALMHVTGIMRELHVVVSQADCGPVANAEGAGFLMNTSSLG